MRYKAIAFSLVLSTFTFTTFAEQPQAAKYREVFQSGNYYIEYEMNYAKKILAVQGQKRMDYTMLKSTPNTALAALGFINPLFAVAGLLGGGEKRVPSTLYQDGKYYQFESKKKATMAFYNQLDDPNIDPAAGWNMVRVKLALPEALVTFAPNDIFNSFTGYKAAKFIESGKKTICKKEYNYDKYSTTFNNLNGQPMYKKNFYMFYDLERGELQRIKCKVRIGNEEEQEVEEMKNIKITGELPEKITDIPEGCKVYAVGLGDINDLMQKPVLVENYSKKEDKSDEN